MKRAIERRRQAGTAWKNSESISRSAAYLRLQQEQHRSRRILRAEVFHSNGKLQTQIRLLQTFFAHVNRNKRLIVRILQLSHPSVPLINSDQEMAELLKTTFLGFFREDEGVRIRFVLGTAPSHVSIPPNQNGTMAKGR